MYNFFSALLARAPTTNGPLSATDPGPPPDSADDTEEGFGPIESGYKGPRVDFPLTKNGLDTLLAAFKHKKVCFRAVHFICCVASETHHFLTFLIISTIIKF